jgi:hypothetical protein
MDERTNTMNQTTTIMITGDFAALIEQRNITWLTRRINTFGVMRDGGDIEVPMTPKQQSRLLSLVVGLRYESESASGDHLVAADQHTHLLRAGVTF